MRHPLILTFLAGAATAATAAETPRWDRPRAFEFMESRQQAWAAWKPAQKPGGPCISCHTGLSYMLARRASGAPDATPSERDLVRGVTQRALASPPTVTMPDPGAEAVLNLLTLALQRPKPDTGVGAAERAALSTLVERQIKDGPARGSWTWVDAGLDPFDAPHSAYFGTALAVFALAAYQDPLPEVASKARDYLQRDLQAQPLHNRLAWLAFVPAKSRDERLVDPVRESAWKAQSPDGGWTTSSMGPWLPQEGNPADPGSNAYMTAFAAYALRQSGVPCRDERLARALAWLERQQDPKTGGWRAVSMNKEYPEGSIQEGFMTDAATGFAAAALLSCAQ